MMEKNVVPKRKPNQKFKLKANQKLNLQSEIDIIVDAYDIFTQSSYKNSRDALKVGKALTITKNKVKKKKGLWLKYRTTDLSHIPPHDIRDFMYLSDHYNKFPLPGLLWVNRTNLKKLYQFCKGKSPKVILADNSIDLISEDATADEIRAFQKEVLELLRPAKAAAKQKNKVTTKQQASEPAEFVELSLKDYRNKFMQSMKQELAKTEDGLKPFRPIELKKYLNAQKTLALYIAKRTPQNDE